MPTVVREIVEQASTDPTFEDDFAPLVSEGKKAVGAFEQSLANFLGNLYGCPDAPPYSGPTMEEAHAGMAITQQEYDDFVALIAGVLGDNGVPNDTINTCFAPPLLALARVGHARGSRALAPRPTPARSNPQ